jgi:hypothetical protein
MLDDGFGVRRSSISKVSPLQVWRFCRAVLETEAVVSGFGNMAAAGEAIKQRYRQLGGSGLWSTAACSCRMRH